MGFHDSLTAPDAIHPAAFVGATDPSLVATNLVLQDKLWIDTSSGPPYALKKRNASNNGWDLVGGTGSTAGGVDTPPARIWRQALGALGAPTLSGTVQVSPVNGLHNGFPSQAITKFGVILVAYRQGTAHASDDGKVTLQTSSDGGQTWSAPVQPAVFTALGHTSSVGGLVTTRTGRLLLTVDHAVSGVPGEGYVSISDDGGATWGSLAPIAPYSSYSYPLGVLQHSSGVLVMAVYGQHSGSTADGCGVLRSTDDGVTWGSLVTIAAQNTNHNETTLVELPNGTIVAYVRNESSTDGLYVATSTDVGLTWSSQTAIGFSIWGGLVGAACVPVGQELLLVYRSATSQETAWRWSADQGATWSAEAILNTDVYVYSALVPLDNHRLGIVYAHQYSGLAQADVLYLTATAGVPTVSGTRAANAAVASLLAGLARQGDVIDTTTAGTAPLTDPTTTEGDLLVRLSGVLARLGVGANGTFLGSNGTDPAWSTPVGQPSSLLMLLPNPYNFVDDSPGDNGQPPDFITVATGDVIGVGGM